MRDRMEGSRMQAWMERCRVTLRVKGCRVQGWLEGCRVRDPPGDPNSWAPAAL